MVNISFKLYFLMIFAFISTKFVNGSSNDICLNKGFNKETLKCDTCESLKKIVSDEDLYKECGSCCTSVMDEKFELAVLELDKRFLSRLPDLKAVLKSNLELSVRYRYGAIPTLLMYKERNDEFPSESINCISWNKELFKDYLSSHL
mmetsp:Transcript_37077/g.37747  ORF Transcript_37077/g.37747 Transcript_37077/m.37747 type:complete len:147 (+) Transcript_37077:141-581(+)